MKIPGFVLAGGASRRMGRDKALVEIGGIPLAARVAAALAAGGCAPVALVGRQPGLAGLGLPVIVEREEELHPLYGVAAALEAARGELALVAPCDLARLDGAAVAALLAAGGPCVAGDGERRHPLLAVLPVGWADRARALAREGAAAGALVAGLPVVVLAAEALVNANTPADLARWG